MNELSLERKLTFRHGGKKLILHKKSMESSEHVIMKAFLWSLYEAHYDNLVVELKINDRFKPDIVALDENNVPMFWGEAGNITSAKLESLIRRYPTTHFAVAKWGVRLHPHVEIVDNIAEKLDRDFKLDLISVPKDSYERFVDGKGTISITFNDVELVSYGKRE